MPSTYAKTENKTKKLKINLLIVLKLKKMILKVEVTKST